MAAHQILIGGFKIPSVGFGTAGLGDQTRLALTSALESGYRHIDTAFVYRNENVIGQVLNEFFSAGKLRREDLFITTKLPPLCLDENSVDDYMKKSLEALQLDYVDLYLIHWPMGRIRDEKSGEFKQVETDHTAIWKKMEEQVKKGKAKKIGLSNFSIEQIESIWQIARIKPVCLQVRIQLTWQQPEFVDYCHKKNIVVVGYSSLKSGGFRLPPTPGQSPPPRNDPLGVQKQQTNDSKRPNILENETLRLIAEKHKRSPAQIVLRYFLQLNIVMIPRSVTPSRIKENLDLFSFSLDKDDIQALKTLDSKEDGQTE